MSKRRLELDGDEQSSPVTIARTKYIGGNEVAKETWQVGIDVGGTFTDVVAVGSRSGIRIHKTASTPDDPSVGVLAGVSALAETQGLTIAPAPPVTGLGETRPTVTDAHVVLGRLRPGGLRRRIGQHPPGTRV
ncbi:hydantoinase/oxoprolinase N-terminal domain-containing protein [Mesorhizobium sp. M0870]|uniref:hydantoinase/oxoprolinase N-terminal domain-containing protein n=1 Tax=Mesorhizobium sp. M0870 TaxID=2957016 RepID=UPI0033383DD4